MTEEAVPTERAHCQSEGVCMKEEYEWKPWDGKSWLCMCTCIGCMNAGRFKEEIVK